MIFLVQAIKKLFVTCHAAYDIRGLGRQPQSNSIYTQSQLHNSNSWFEGRKEKKWEAGEAGGWQKKENEAQREQSGLNCWFIRTG